MPKVSIVTPCYNLEKYIAPAIASVCSQSFSDWEHLVLNDGSTDRSLNIIQSYAAKEPRLKVISQDHGGVCNARNNGFKATSPGSAYLLFLDADDCLEPTMLETMVDYMSRHPEVGLTYCRYIYIDQNDSLSEAKDSKCRYIPKGLWVDQLPPGMTETPFISVFSSCGIIPSISLIRRSVYEQTPQWDETFGHGHEDADLFIHMALITKVHYLSYPLVRRRRHPGQSTVNSAHYIFQQKKLYEKWRKKIGLTEEQKAAVREARRFREGRLESFLAFQRAKGYWDEGKFTKAARFYLGGTRRYLMSFIPYFWS